MRSVWQYRPQVQVSDILYQIVSRTTCSRCKQDRVSDIKRITKGALQITLSHTTGKWMGRPKCTNRLFSTCICDFFTLMGGRASPILLKDIPCTRLDPQCRKIHDPGSRIWPPLPPGVGGMYKDSEPIRFEHCGRRHVFFRSLSKISELLS